MHFLKFISRIATTALLLVLMLLCDNAGIAAPREPSSEASGLSLVQRRTNPAGEAVIQPVLTGLSSCFRRGDDGPPPAHGNTALDLLPGHAAIWTAPLGPGDPHWPALATSGFARVQDKLLFPKHWFW